MGMACFNTIVKSRFFGDFLIIYRFFLFYLVVSRKKRIFAFQF